MWGRWKEPFKLKGQKGSSWTKLYPLQKFLKIKKKPDQEFLKETCNQHIYKMQLHGNQIHWNKAKQPIYDQLMS